MPPTPLDTAAPGRTPHPLAVGGAARGIIRPWLITTAIATLLGVIDNVIPNGAIDTAFDVSVNLLGAAGLVLATRASVLALRHGEVPRHRIGLRGTVYGAGFFGPMLATVMLTWASHDIDGARWMLFSPVMGVMLVGVALLLGRTLR